MEAQAETAATMWPLYLESLLSILSGVYLGEVLLGRVTICVEFFKEFSPTQEHEERAEPTLPPPLLWQDLKRTLG